MKQEVLVSVSGLQFEVESDQPIELISPGKYFCKNKKHYIMYDEISEESNAAYNGISKNLLKISPSRIELSKKGHSNVTMTFEKDKKSLTCYSTPYGELIIGIHTTDLKVEELPDALNADIHYSLDINYNHISECNIHIHIENKKEMEIKEQMTTDSKPADRTLG